MALYQTHLNFTKSQPQDTLTNIPNVEDLATSNENVNQGHTATTTYRSKKDQHLKARPQDCNIKTWQAPPKIRTHKLAHISVIQDQKTRKGALYKDNTKGDIQTTSQFPQNTTQLQQPNSQLRATGNTTSSNNITPLFA